MKTLYEVLGVSKQATLPDIVRGYQASLDALSKEAANLHAEEFEMRAKVIKEAHSILASPARRAAYDGKLRNKERALETTDERLAFPWMKLVIGLLMIGACFYIYEERADKAEAELAALEAQKAAAEAERAAQLALAEQARVELQRMQEQRQIQLRQEYEFAQARQEGHQIHERMQKVDAQIARDKLTAERQAQTDKAREEQAIKARSHSEISAMERALNIPIRRH